MKNKVIDLKLLKAAASRTAFSHAGGATAPAQPQVKKANRSRLHSLNFRVSEAVFEETRNAAATLRVTQVEFIEEALRERLEKVKAEQRRIGGEWVTARPPRNTRATS
jgi:hypothetical protein